MTGGDRIAITPDDIVVERVHAEASGVVMRYTASTYDGDVLEGIVREPSGDGDVEHWIEDRNGTRYRRAYGAVSLGRTYFIPPVESTRDALADALTRFRANHDPAPAVGRLF